MTIRAKVFNGTVTIPSEIHLPDGTEVELSIVADIKIAGTEINLPVYGGGAPYPGIDLNDTSSLWPLLDGEKYPRPTE